MRFRSFILPSLFCAIASAAAAQGQFPPRSFQNLLVIPKNVATAEVINTMKGFTAALGVRCQFCHVGEEGMPLEKFDFVSDAVPQKNIARRMYRMVEEIRRQVEVAKPAEAGLRVTCYTCHRGQTKPATTPG